ncbi:STAS domain-containing protein [Streptomyces sp. NPDC089919]|uniref:STAS domain-containing protein n=1 Tax=Streptomyces sp. NPDC089919 TaxID=3155188 RepID=UPI003438EC52
MDQVYGYDTGADIPVQHQDDMVVVRPTGELDIDRATGLKRVLLAELARTPQPGRLVVDMTGVTFCDSTGLNALLTARRQAGDQNVPLVLSGARDQFLRLLELTDTLLLFTLEPAPPVV